VRWMAWPTATRKRRRTVFDAGRFMRAPMSQLGDRTRIMPLRFWPFCASAVSEYPSTSGDCNALQPPTSKIVWTLSLISLFECPRSHSLLSHTCAARNIKKEAASEPVATSTCIRPDVRDKRAAVA